MNRIIENIKDPSWWFTAVLVAIIASLFAAYAKDFIGTFLSTLSERYKVRKEKRDIEKERIIQNSASDPTLLLTLFIFSVANLFIFLFSVTIFLLIPMWREIVLPSLVIEGLNVKPILSIALTLFTGFFIIKTGTRSLSNLDTCNKSLNLYMENKKAKVTNDTQPLT